jgi:hypothetical protein
MGMKCSGWEGSVETQISGKRTMRRNHRRQLGCWTKIRWCSQQQVLQRYRC